MKVGLLRNYGYLALILLFFCLNFYIRQGFSAVSDGFDYPVGSYGTYSLCPDNKGSSSCYWLCQGFLKDVDSSCNGINSQTHLGEDWNRGSERDDYGDTIYVVSHGEIVYAQKATGWGNVLIIRHTLPDGIKVETLYGHLKDMFVTSGSVSRGQPIGTIGDGDATQPVSPHLHFEIRYPNCPSWGLPGPGYSLNPAGWTDPSDFINAHRSFPFSPCHQYSVGSSIPQGFGVPWDVFSPSIMEITATCSGSVATIDMNATPNPQYQSRYVYNIGYSAQPGAASWTPFTLTGEGLISNAWLPGRGTASISLQDTAKPTYVLGYLCTWTGSQWKCGCRDAACMQSYWQLQGIPPIAGTPAVNMSQAIAPDVLSLR